MKNDNVEKKEYFTVAMPMKSKALQAKYDALRAKMNEVKVLKDDFEDHFMVEARKNERIDKDIALAFGYYYGKLSIAKVDKDTPKAKGTKKPEFTF